MALWILRAVFLVVAIALAVAISSNPEMRSGFRSIGTILLFTVGTGAIIGLDLLIKKKRIDLITSIYFGLIVGLFLTYIISVALDPMFDSYAQAAVPADQVGNRISVETLKLLAHSFFGVVICYICISMLWQTKDDFRFIIPYVEFARDSKSLKPYVLDTSVVIDGRIADILETGVIDNPIIMPRFVLNELQNIADSSDKLRRARGRRGLDVLNRLRSNESIEMQVYERELPEMDDETVDSKLLLLAKHLDGKVVTGDFNLNKVAKLQNVPVINLNDIANSIKPVFLPGETINVKIVKQGEEAGQGIGYLDDGTMVVVEDGRGKIGNLIDITVTSMLQTSAGRMVFGKIANGK